MTATNEAQVDEAIEHLNLPPRSIEKLSALEAQGALSAVRSAFVEGNPRALWLGLKLPSRALRYEQKDWPDCLVQACASVGATEGFLIIESSGEGYLVYRCTSFEAVGQVLSECGFFEYAIVDYQLQWLIADTDHNEMIIVSKIAEQLAISV